MWSDSSLPHILVNGHTETAEIAVMCARRYKDAYTGISTHESETNGITGDIQRGIIERNTDCYLSTTICIMFASLAKRQFDCRQGTQSDHFIFSSHIFRVMFTFLVNAMLVHV